MKQKRLVTAILLAAGMVTTPRLMAAEAAPQTAPQPDAKVQAAQPTVQPTAEDVLTQKLNAVADDLKLTDQQRKDAVPILKDTILQARTVMGGTNAPLEKRDQLMALRKSSHDKLASILTLQQLDELEQKRDVVRQQVQAALWGQQRR